MQSKETIANFKRNRTANNTFDKEGFDRDVEQYIDRMYDINGTLWNYETQMRKLMDSRNGTGPIVDANDLPLVEIGKLALLVRDLNGTRNGLKSEIVEKFSEGFKDIKINYVKTDYPVLSNLGLKFEDGN